MKTRSRTALLAALAALALMIAAAPALARSGYQVFTSGLYGIEARATLNHRALTIDKWRCHYGSTFGPSYEIFQPNQGRIKVSKSGRFNTHIELHAEFENTAHELVESEQKIAISGRFVKGKIKGTIANVECDGGKPQPFTMSSFGFEV
jgi:hypothetical protein